jgi:hypothetical protein
MVCIERAVLRADLQLTALFAPRSLSLSLRDFTPLLLKHICIRLSAAALCSQQPSALHTINWKAREKCALTGVWLILCDNHAGSSNKWLPSGASSRSARSDTFPLYWIMNLWRTRAVCLYYELKSVLIICAWKEIVNYYEKGSNCMRWWFSSSDTYFFTKVCMRAILIFLLEMKHESYAS